MSNNPDRIKTAKPNSWKRLEMPTQVASLSIDKTFTIEEFHILSHGLIPEVMEDKWFIFMQNTTLFFHRSWTGICIYQATLKQNQTKYILQKALVNQNPEEHIGKDLKYESALLRWLIDGLLLHKNVSFPVRQNLPKDIPPGVYQHHIAGTAFPETQNSDR